MKKIITLFIFFAVAFKINGQTIANVEGVFGGSISAITGGQKNGSPDSFTIFISTQSANSIFYTTAVVPSSGAATTVDSFKVLDAASSASGFGSGINKLAYHAQSGKIFFISASTVYYATTASSSATAITSISHISDIAILGNKFFAMTNDNPDNTFYTGTLDASGNLTINTSATITGQGYSNLVVGKNDKLYAFKASSDPQAVEFGGNISTGVNLSSATTNTLSGLSSSINWAAMAVYNDGTVFIGGNDASGKQMAKAPNFTGTYTTNSLGIVGNSGPNIEFRTVNASSYFVYFGSAYSNNNGNSGSWQNLGNTSFETHPNDGTVFFIKNHPNTGGVLLLTTDQGLGITKNSGSVITEVDEGINAVQVKDFDMNAAKDFGWLASKSGIRYVENYNTASKAWSKAIFPNGDGAPYYSCEMVTRDTAYVGNNRVYKTNNKGTTWTQLFDANISPYNLTGAVVSTIAIGGSNNQIVMAGYKQLVGNNKGGVFYSLNGGSSWQQLLINAASIGQDVNVNDIEMTIDSGLVVAYIGVNYNSATTPVTKGMYKAKYNGTSWAVSSEPIYASSSSLISVTDIGIISKDTIVAVGAFYNPSLAHEYPIHFEISRTVKNTWSSTVVDATRVGGYEAVSWSGDTLFYAYNNVIYWDEIQFHSTYTYRRGEAEYYSVPVGTEINVLFYDELVAGTETDIRSIRGASTIRTPIRTATHRTACSGGTITGGTPSGGYYYIVDTLADAYVLQSNGEYYLLFATNGILNGTSSSAFENTAEITAAFPTLTLTYFTAITTYPAAGTYIIGYTDASYSGASATDTTTVSSAGNVDTITGTNYSCNGPGATSQLSNSTSGGVWSSSNNGVATINASTGLVTVAGFGTSVINYTVTISGCSSAATTNFNVAGLPNLDSITGNSRVCVGSSIQLSNTTNLPMGTTTTWSSIAGRATVSSNGLTTGTSAGNASIKYTASNVYGCSSYTTKNISVNAIPPMPTISYAPGTTGVTGASGTVCKNKPFTLIGKPAGGTWSSSLISINGSGFVNTGNATGAASVTYSYTDNKGCNNSRTINTTIVACRGINEQSIINEIVVYPNPAKSFIYIKLNKLTNTGSITITDLYGKQLKQQPLSMGVNTIDISPLAKGIYIATIITDDGKQTRKMIVD